MKGDFRVTIVQFIVVFLVVCNISFGQSIVEPASITIGIDQISSVDGDTILLGWKTRSAFRGGFFSSSEITNASTGLYSIAYGNVNTAEGVS